MRYLKKNASDVARRRSPGIVTSDMRLLYACVDVLFFHNLHLYDSLYHQWNVYKNVICLIQLDRIYYQSHDPDIQSDDLYNTHKNRSQPLLSDLGMGAEHLGETFVSNNPHNVNNP